MFDFILDQYNPRESSSHSILKFFSEDLKDDEKSKFIDSLFEKHSWLLPIEISNLSGSLNLKNNTKNIFFKIFQEWVDNRITHSLSIPFDIKNPNIPIVYLTEYREILISICNLGFPDEIMEVYDRLIVESNPSYFKKLIEHSFWIIVEEFSPKEIEAIFTHFSRLYLKNTGPNISNFLYGFLNSLAHSEKIFDLSEEFLTELNLLSSAFMKRDLKKDYSFVISVLLIEFIQKKELDLSNTSYENIIDLSYNELSKGKHENLVFCKFLKDFNFHFRNHDFNLELGNLLENFNSRVIFLKTASEIQKQATLKHYTNTSEQYFELFLFYLERCNEDQIVLHFIKFINLIDELKELFLSFLWFEEYLNLSALAGRIDSIVNNGFYVKIDETTINTKKKDFGQYFTGDFFSQSSVGFLSDISLNDFPRNSKLYCNLGSGISASIKRSIIESSLTGEQERFFISRLNYSKGNKGAIITFIPANKQAVNLISKYSLRSFFSSVELFLVEKAHEFLNIESPFQKGSFLVKKMLYFKFINDYKISLSEDGFKKIFEQLRPSIYKTIYLDYKEIDEAFKKIVVAYEAGATVMGTVKSIKSGGLSVDIFGLQAFLPGSQIANKPNQEYSSYIGKTMDFKIIQISPKTKNIVISNKLLEDEKADELWYKLEVGQIIEGRVTNVTGYGVFVSFGIFNGLIHRSELSWGEVNHPEEVVKLEQNLRAIILALDYETKHIHLSLKRLTSDPWDTVNSDLKVGTIVEGKVSIISSYGIFVEIYPGIKGLLHKSQLTRRRRRETNFGFNLGDLIETYIHSIDLDQRKIFLTIPNGNSWNNLDPALKAGRIIKGKIVDANNFGVFVEICPSMVGLLHKSRLPFNTRRKANYGYRVDDIIEVSIISINKDQQRIALDIPVKDPWYNLDPHLMSGCIVNGKVVYIAKFGVLIELAPGVNGLLHVSKLAYKLRHKNNFGFRIGDVVEVQVIAVKKEKHKILLQIPRVPH